MSVSLLDSIIKIKRDRYQFTPTIGIEAMVVPFYLEPDGTPYRYVAPPPQRLISRSIRPLAWQSGRDEIVIGTVDHMWNSSYGVMASASIDIVDRTTPEPVRTAVDEAVTHLRYQRPVWVSPHIPHADGQIYRTKGYTVVDFEITRVTLSNNNHLSTWSNHDVTPVKIDAYTQKRTDVTTATRAS